MAIISSPFLHQRNSTGWMMRQVILATLPGTLALTVFFGAGTLINILWCVPAALAGEALILYWRKRPVKPALQDASAVLTALLLAIALPPAAPWWLCLCGSLFAIVVAKQLYGGLGYNLFNPAMAAYVLLLISMPLPMTQWAAPGFTNPVDALLFSLDLAAIPDGYSMATPLDIVKHNNSFMMEQLWQNNRQFGWLAGVGWEWVNMAFLAGGLYLLYQRIYTWHAPVSMLAALGLCAVLGYDGGSSASAGSPLFHWFSGATMLGAWFIVTDPVTSAVSRVGRIVYGALAGVLIYLIRVYGNYPDAVAFAVLLINLAAPCIDYFTQPTAYGHRKQP